MLDELKPEREPDAPDAPDAQPEQSGGCESDNSAGDYTLQELTRELNKNVDPLRRRIDRPEQDD